MNRLFVAFFTTFWLLAAGAGSVQAQAQQHPPAVKPARPIPPPHVNRYRKKDTVKPDPYVADTLLNPIPISRALFHDKIDKEQAKADLADGKADTIITIAKDAAMTAALTKALLHDVDNLQVMIENMPPEGKDAFAENQQKIQGLRALWEMMRLYNNDVRPDPAFYIKLVANMHDMLVAANKNKLMEFAQANNNIYTLDNGITLLDNHPDIRAYIYTEVGRQDPVMMIKRLPEYAKDTFAGQIISAAARLVPNVIFNYATSSNNALRNAVFQTRDSLVQGIVSIASRSRAPIKAFPFLSDIYRGRKSIEEIDTLADHPDLYYKELVRLRIENDTLTRKIYTDELQYRTLKYFVRQMNELHEAKDEVRFKCIDSLGPAPLYYIMVYGQDEIYTSSFLGTFKRMMERMAPMKGDQLLDSVLHYDHFRTFIRMCAGYNTLSTFLGSVDDTSRNTLMGRFIAGLQNGKEDELEDAVDVADALGSIRDSALAVFLEKKVKENYELSYKDQSKKGMIVYSLLAMLTQSSKMAGNDTGAAVVSQRMHLPLINKVPFKQLANDLDIVYQQVFFYGDEDGKAAYDGFMEEFKRTPAKWKIGNEKYWTAISSVAGKKIVIYANLPLPEPQDEVAQDSLNKFLNDSGIHPTIMIHRGHSYHLPMTLARLNKQVKIVILGSCGGYHNLATVLDKSPDAHIVSSKQTGVGAINEPIIKSLNAMLLEGNDVNWIAMWKELDELFSKKKDLHEKYEDYVPPYKNLGALFIKSYRQMLSAASAQ